MLEMSDHILFNSRFCEACYRTLAKLYATAGVPHFCYTHFLSRVSILTRDIDIANLYVCLSVSQTATDTTIVTIEGE